MSVASQVFKNCKAFLNDVGYAGEVDEVTLPKLTTKDEEFLAAGMAGPVSIPMSIEKLEASFVVSSLLYEFLVQWGLRNGNATKLTLRSAMEDLDGTPHSDVAKLYGRVSGLDESSSKPGEKKTWTFTMQVTFYERTIDGQEAIYIDLENMVCRVGGVDQLEAIRNIIEG